jgi:hypothetical protein
LPITGSSAGCKLQSKLVDSTKTLNTKPYYVTISQSE